MECSKNLLLAVLLLGFILHGDSAPSARRSRNAKTLEQTTVRESKLEDQFKEVTTTSPTPPSSRRNKALNLFGGYFPSFLSSGLDYAEDDDEDVTFSVNDDNFDDDDLSRTIPSKRRQQNKKKNGNGNFNNDNINSLQYDNSPIFYIRLPPTPYMFVPGLGYVSQPPNLGPPNLGPMGPIPQGVPQQMGYPPSNQDPFINLPLDFVSNGKPTGVYQWGGAPGYPQMPQMDPYGYGAPQQMIPPQPSYNVPNYSKPKPKPVPTNSKVTNLKGQYAFNGKPGENVFVLRDTYNSIYSDALQNFYP